MINVENKHLEIAKILVDEIKYGRTIFYDDVRKQVGMSKEEMRILWGYLGDLSYFSFENKMPLISAMVINKVNNIPGDGFYGVFEELKSRRIKNDDEKIEVFVEELRLITEYRDWQTLIQLLEDEIGESLSSNNLRLKVNRIKKIKPFKKIALVNDNNKEISNEELYREGKEKLEIHVKKERNSRIINDAKQDFINKNGKLFCGICGFDFERVYGDLGKDFIEGHHVNPIGKMKGEVESKIEDIKMVCSNCHRMVHRGIERGITIEQITKEIVKNS